jgi:ribonuclease BN (tRNA processing enzyme)
LTNIRRVEIPLESVRQVYITHTHSDHIGEFTGLIWAMALEGRTERLEVVSSKETAATLRHILKL